MGYVGKAPAASSVTSADIADGTISNADLAAAAAVAMSKTALSAGTGITLDTNTLNVDASQAQITTVGTIGVGTWQASDVGVQYGGTGASALTDHGVVLGSGTAAVSVTAAGTSGQALISGGSGADPAFAEVSVPGGGTGATSLTDHGVVLGSGAAAVSVTAAGTSGQVLTSGGGSADPDWADAAGGGNTHALTATGAITNGDLVSLNSNGTVSETVTVSAGAGTPVVYKSAVTAANGITYDSNSNKVVVICQDATVLSMFQYNKGVAQVGTVNPVDNSISFGSGTVFTDTRNNGSMITFDSNSNKVVVAWRSDMLTRGRASVGTVSGTSISFGTHAEVDPGNDNNFSVSGAGGATFDSNSNKVVLCYTDTNSNYGIASVGTVSGTDISFGTAATFESSSADFVNATFDSNSNKVVIVYRDWNNSIYGTAIVGTVSGTNISFGSAVVFEAGSTNNISMDFDSNSNKVVVAYEDGSDSGKGKAIVGTVSGTSISFGSAVTFSNNDTGRTATTFDSTNNKIVISYDDDTSSTGKAVIGSVSGTSITFESSVTEFDGQIVQVHSTYDANAAKTVFSYEDDANGDKGTAAVFESGSSTRLDWVGIATADIADGASGDIGLVGSVNAGQSSLTIGSKYYLQDNSTLSTTVATGREVGRALSATELLITQGGVS